GVIHLAGLYLGFSDQEINQKIIEIEATTAQILRRSESSSSTHAAAIAVANQRITQASKEQVHAG
ncbi:MAG: hypothetical protein ACYSXF_04490, partial [Planctomycetota bacterium]